ncbi:hypothetical protein [Marivita sp.]|uniref:hypothetical protein n=1 Tax=Marivita sp. TaxID=2003365 RepID=UPI00260709D9|nr:hypothetical protein [Marivita sp.]
MRYLTDSLQQPRHNEVPLYKRQKENADIEKDSYIMANFFLSGYSFYNLSLSFFTGE